MNTNSIIQVNEDTKWNTERNIKHKTECNTRNDIGGHMQMENITSNKSVIKAQIEKNTEYYIKLENNRATDKTTGRAKGLNIWETKLDTDWDTEWDMEWDTGCNTKWDTK